MPPLRAMMETTEPDRTAGFAPLESGIILPIPEAEAAVGQLRRLHDPQARYGVPAHITLLYPFAHPSRVGDAAAALQRLFRRVPTFEFSLAEVRQFPQTVYLHPEPSHTFVRLVQMLVQEWPQFPPYRGAFSAVIPHLTVADHCAADVRNTVDASVASRLPIRCRASEAWLMCSDEEGFWSRRDVFRFGEP